VGRCETCRRMLALLQLVERPEEMFGEIGTDAVIDAWFGQRSRAFPGAIRTPKSRPAEAEAS
jgi:hypothetical protein